MSEMPEAPTVSVLLVNWNGLADTRECLISLERVTYPAVSVVVVDNGSVAPEAEAIQAEFPGVEVLRAGRNLGFTGGNNIGIRHALARGADYILCLNNDTVVDPDFLTPLVQALEDKADAGVAAGLIYYFDRPEVIWSIGSWVDLSCFPPLGHIRDLSQLSLKGNGTAEVVAVDGCVLLMRRAVAELVGGFDEAFFAYTEDADLCLRAAKAGWKCLAVPASRVWHKVSSSTGGENSPTAEHYSIRNFYCLVRRYATAKQRRAFLKQEQSFLRHQLSTYLAIRQQGKLSGGDVTRAWLALDSIVNALIGRIGFDGPRAKYRVVESTLRMGIQAAAVMFSSPYLTYRRIYWKLYSISAILTRVFPPPSL